MNRRGNTFLKKPNLMRVAMELSTYRSPYKTADLLLSMVKSSLENSTDSKEDVGLLRSNVIIGPNESQRN